MALFDPVDSLLAAGALGCSSYLLNRYHRPRRIYRILSVLSLLDFFAQLPIALIESGLNQTFILPLILFGVLLFFPSLWVHLPSLLLFGFDETLETWGSFPTTVGYIVDLIICASLWSMIIGSCRNVPQILPVIVAISALLIIWSVTEIQFPSSNEGSSLRLYKLTLSGVIVSSACFWFYKVRKRG